MIKVIKSVPFGATTPEEVNEYTDYYKLLECTMFDVVYIDYKGTPLSLFIDDEGMMKANNLGRLVEGYPQPLFGTIVITGSVDDEGETLSVPDWFTTEDAIKIIGTVQWKVK